MAMQGAARTRLASFGILAVVLAAGFLMGWAWERRVLGTPSPTEEPQGVEARSGERPEGRGRGERRLIIYEVQLSDVQKTGVDSIVEHYMAEGDVLMEEYRARSEELQREARRSFFEQVRALESATVESIKTLLTEEQIVTYDSLRAEHRSRRERSRGDSSQNRAPGQDRSPPEGVGIPASGASGRE